MDGSIDQLIGLEGLRSGKVSKGGAWAESSSSHVAISTPCSSHLTTQSQSADERSIDAGASFQFRHYFGF